MFLSRAGKCTELFIMLLFECLKYLIIFKNVKCFGTKICEDIQARARDIHYVLYLRFIVFTHKHTHIQSTYNLLYLWLTV